MENEKLDYTKLPKKAFDKEYSTDWRKEVAWLRSRGIQPTYRKTNEFGVERYKYTKTPELFAALAIFYKQIQDELQWRRINEMMESVKDVQISQDDIKVVADTILAGDVDTSNIHSLKELAAKLSKGEVRPAFVADMGPDEEDDTL